MRWRSFAINTLHFMVMLGALLAGLAVTELLSGPGGDSAALGKLQPHCQRREGSPGLGWHWALGLLELWAQGHHFQFQLEIQKVAFFPLRPCLKEQGLGFSFVSLQGLPQKWGAASAGLLGSSQPLPGAALRRSRAAVGHGSMHWAAFLLGNKNWSMPQLRQGDIQFIHCIVYLTAANSSQKEASFP